MEEDECLSDIIGSLQRQGENEDTRKKVLFNKRQASWQQVSEEATIAPRNRHNLLTKRRDWTFDARNLIQSGKYHWQFKKKNFLHVFLATGRASLKLPSFPWIRSKRPSASKLARNDAPFIRKEEKKEEETRTRRKGTVKKEKATSSPYSRVPILFTHDV